MTRRTIRRTKTSWDSLGVSRRSFETAPLAPAVDLVRLVLAVLFLSMRTLLIKARLRYILLN